MLNLTISSLLLSYFSSSPLFSLGHFNGNFSQMTITKSFSTAIFTPNLLRVSRSKFTDFLSTAIHMNEIRYGTYFQPFNSNPVNPEPNFYSVVFIRCTASATTNFNGGAITFVFQTNTERFTASSCSFWYCSASNCGGAIYSQSPTNEFLIQYSNFGHCAAKDGASVYITNAKQFTTLHNYFDSSAPIRRCAQSDGCYVSAETFRAGPLNFSRCNSLCRCSAFYYDIKSGFNVSMYVLIYQCSGVNTIGLVSFNKLSLSNFHLINNTIIESTSSSGNIYIMGEFEFRNSQFAISNYPLIGGSGLVTFRKCFLDFDPQLQKNAFFIYCSNIGYNSISQTIRSLERNQAELQEEGYPPFFHDESVISHNPNKANPPTPRTHGYVHNKNGQMALAGFFLSFVFLGCSIAGFFILKRHRRHILKYLYNSYVYEYQWKNKGLGHKNETEELAKDHDDYEGNLNPEMFQGVEIPSTHLWDTDDGGPFPQPEPFTADVAYILEQQKQEELDDAMKKSTSMRSSRRKKKSRKSSRIEISKESERK